MKPIANELIKIAKLLTKTAGATNFMSYGKGTNPNTVFREIVEQARRHQGDGGYTGTIAEKDNFKIVTNPMTRQDAEQKADQLLNSQTCSDKWGPACAIPILAESDHKEIPFEKTTWAPNTQTARTQIVNEITETNKAKGLLTKINHYDLKIETKKASKISLKATGKQKPEIRYVIRSKERNLQYAPGQPEDFASPREALDSIKTRVQDQAASGKDVPSQIYVVAIIKETTQNALTIDIVPRSEKGNQYIVKGKATISKPNTTIEGYLFFGWAST